MELEEAAFNEQFIQTLDTVIETMAETPEIGPEKFFSMVCLLENLQFFGPVIYSALKSNPEDKNI